MVCFPKTFLLSLWIVYCSPNPRNITISGLGSSYFARHYFRNRVFFLFLWVLRCFSSPRTLRDHSRWLVFNQPGYPIRTSPDQFLFADPRSLSQLTTSFFASGSQGILRSLLFSFSYFISESFATFTSQIILLVCLWNCSPYFATRKNSNLLLLYRL